MNGVQHGARYRGGGDVLKRNAREARSVTIPDTSPVLGWGPSARFMPVNFVSAKKLWTCLATEAPVTDVAANYRSHP